MVEEVTVYLDTQVAVWLSAGKLDGVSNTARNLIEGTERLLVSPMVLLEIEYLYEINRITERASYVMADLSWKLGLQVCQLSLAITVASALDIKWTRDPFDRMIVANAIANRNAILLSADHHIQSHYSFTRW